MGEATGVGDHLGDDRTPAELAARADELMARIEDEGLVSGWVWGPLSETMARLSALPDELAWVKVAYLSAVIVRGDSMFRHSTTQQELAGLARDTWPPVPCACGESIPGERPARPWGRSGREVVLVRCPACGLEMTVYDGEPYTGDTLLTRGGV